jgi:homoserine kinase
LVEQATNVAVGFDVGGVAVTQEVEDLSQGGAGGLVAGLDVGELLLDPAELAGDALVFALEQVDRDRAGVVRVEQLLPLSDELGPLLREPEESWWMNL